jgi:hypothetical protein
MAIPGLCRIHELDRQPIEQFRVRRKPTLDAEVVLGLDQPAAEELLPGAVDDDPRGERVVGGDEPFCEFEPGRRPRDAASG